MIRSGTQKKFSVTVGIPAYNEEGNIGALLANILGQDQAEFELAEILVYSDGSTDRTEEIVMSFGQSGVKLLRGTKRVGQQLAQNSIAQAASGDIVIFIEADTRPANPQTLGNLIVPFYADPEIGMVVGRAQALPPRSYYGRLISAHHVFKTRLFARLNNGVNVYNASGHAMKAMPAATARMVKWPTDVPEDIYVFLLLQKRNLRIVINPDAAAYFSNVNSAADRVRQSRKFLTGRKAIANYFSESIVNQTYGIPKGILLRHIGSEFVRNPFMTFVACAEIVVNRMLSYSRGQFTALYDPYYSSKELQLTKAPNGSKQLIK